MDIKEDKNDEGEELNADIDESIDEVKEEELKDDLKEEEVKEEELKDEEEGEVKEEETKPISLSDNIIIPEKIGSRPFIKDEEEEEVKLDDLEDIDELDEASSLLKQSSEESRKEIQELTEEKNKIEELIKNNPNLINRVETKHDFASEVVNSKSNQKISNLETYEINDLLDKRRFMNNCKVFGWDIVADIAFNTIKDIENYSLSKEGFLISLAMIESTKQSSNQKIEQIEGRKR